MDKEKASEFPENKIQKVRELFFPLIGEETKERIITGFNIYNANEIKDVNALFQVNYLHSNLRKEDKHRREFERFISEYGLPHLIEGIDANLLVRNADYFTQPYWDDPIDVRYFTTKAKELSREEVFDYDGTIIAESKQYDMLIGVDNRKDLRQLLKMFRKHFYLNYIDSYGRYILDEKENKIPNDKAVKNDPWDIPLITIGCRNNRLIRGFKKIKQVNLRKIKKEDVWDKIMLISSLTDKRFDLFIKELKNNKHKYNMDYKSLNKLVNRLFVDEYINVD